MNKFWPKNSPGFHLYPHQVITTRERGDIPGCTPAPREGIYRPTRIENAHYALGLRADKYCAAIQGWIDGNDFGTTDLGQRWQAMWRASGHTDPIHGAYGEKL
jgi:hypothetical protein